MVLYFITGNPGKFSEAKQMLPNIEQLFKNYLDEQNT